MDRELLVLLHNETELRRFQAAEIESVFAHMEQAGWRVVRDRQPEATAVDGPFYDAALATEIERAAAANPDVIESDAE